MIRFRCHRCKRPIAAPDGHVGKKVKCPGCMIVTIVPDIPGAQAAKAKSAKPTRAAPPPPPVPKAPKGPPNPLDELTAAMGGSDVETAAFDDEYTQYEQVETYDGVDPSDPFDQFAPQPGSSRAAAPRPLRKTPSAGMGPGDILLCIFFPLIGLIVGLVRQNKRAGGQMVKLSLVLMAISFVIGLIAVVIQQRMLAP